MKRNCRDCAKREAVVGIGTPVRWVCLNCYQDSLRTTKKLILAALKEVEPRG